MLWRSAPIRSPWRTPSPSSWGRILLIIILCSFCFAENIISLAPNLTELVYYLGGEKKLVGITGDCNYPLQLQKLPRMGKYQFPSIEAIIALQPATVIAEDTADKRFLNKLDNLHIPYKLYRLQQLTDIIPTGKKLASDFTLNNKPLNKLEQKMRKPLPKKYTSAIIILWSQPLIAAGQNTFISEYWLRKGYKNLTPQNNYPMLSKELILAHPEAKIIDLSKDPKQDIYLRLSPRLIETL